MDKNRIRILFARHLANTIGEEERVELIRYMREIDELSFSEMVDDLIDVEDNSTFRKEMVFEAISAEIEAFEKTAIQSLVPWYKQTWFRMAAILICVCSLALLFNNKLRDNVGLASKYKSSEIDGEQALVLSEQQAIVTLADGQKMLFDSQRNDTLRHKGLAIVRLGDGSISIAEEQVNAYFGDEEKHHFAAPKGVTIRLILPDKSIVWLNSESAINLFASYGKETRSVELKGEAYFEVEPNAAKPFLVNALGTQVKVLGTKFNVSALTKEDQVQTTLLSGSVHVRSANKNMELRPGQQAIVKHNQAIELVSQVDLKAVLAWKEGYFRFKDEPISKVMEELAKWYPITNIEIRAGSQDKFTGSIQRSKKLSDLLHTIEQVSDLRFVIQEGRVVVMK